MGCVTLKRKKHLYGYYFISYFWQNAYPLWKLNKYLGVIKHKVSGISNSHLLSLRLLYQICVLFSYLKEWVVRTLGCNPRIIHQYHVQTKVPTYQSVGKMFINTILLTWILKISYYIFFLQFRGAFFKLKNSWMQYYTHFRCIT